MPSQLHQLLSEQLQDDFLEDSIVSTVTSGRGEDLSTLSSPSRTPSPDVVSPYHYACGVV